MARVQYGWVRSDGPDGMDIVPVYIKGTTTREDEGIVGHDIRVRPKNLGPGPYTFIVSPDDIIEIKGFMSPQIPHGVKEWRPPK